MIHALKHEYYSGEREDELKIHLRPTEARRLVLALIRDLILIDDDGDHRGRFEKRIVEAFAALLDTEASPTVHTIDRTEVAPPKEHAP